MKTLEAKGLYKSYGKKEVLKDINLTIELGKIYGLLGRNGAGKTTMLSIMTAQNTHDKGEVYYDGQKVWENAKALGELCFSRELSPTIMFGQNTLKIRDYLLAARTYYPHWDEEYAKRLLVEFELNPKTKIYKLSKGMMSMVTIVIAMASNAPITMLDEPVAGLDVVAREQFYHLLLEDYAKTNRTFIISTHIIEEAAAVFEEVIIVDGGKIIEKQNTEELLSQFTHVTGREDEVARACDGLTVVTREKNGRSSSAVVRKSELNLSAFDVTCSPMSLQRVFVALTGAHREV